MKDKQDNDAMCFHSKVNAEWEPMGGNTTDILVNRCKDHRLFGS